MHPYFCLVGANSTTSNTGIPCLFDDYMRYSFLEWCRGSDFMGTESVESLVSGSSFDGHY